MVAIEWRRDLKRKLIWLLAIKLAALTLAGLFLFSAAQRVDVNSNMAAENLRAQP